MHAHLLTGHRLLARSLAVVAMTLIFAGGESAGGSADANEGPPLSEPHDLLAAALNCPTHFQGLHEPVILIPGTSVSAEDTWSWNYASVLPQLGYDVCLVHLPDRGLGDIQVASEYVVYAIRHVAEQSPTGKVDVMGHSQGGLEPRWALRWWPDTRFLVDDLIQLAAPNHGSDSVDLLCLTPCDPALWQMRIEANFIAALNSGSEVFPSVSYTSVISRTDQFVEPSLPGKGVAALAEPNPPANVSNLVVQDLCPGRPVDHFQMTYDAAVFAIVTDALRNAGPANPARINPAVCDQGVMSGVNPVVAAQETDKAYSGVPGALLAEPVGSEPPLAPYTRASSNN